MFVECLRGHERCLHAFCCDTVDSLVQLIRVTGYMWANPYGFEGSNLLYSSSPAISFRRDPQITRSSFCIILSSLRAKVTKGWQKMYVYIQMTLYSHMMYTNTMFSHALSIFTNRIQICCLKCSFRDNYLPKQSYHIFPCNIPQIL